MYNGGMCMGGKLGKDGILDRGYINCSRNPENEMKIILVDNFDRNRINDQLIAENVSIYWGNKIVTFLNDKYSGNDSSDFFRLEKDNYKLHKFEP